jgi:hypothetical protein
MDGAGLRDAVVVVLLFEVRGPGMFYQHPEDQGRRHCKARVIKKSYGNKTEDERVSRAPEPYVLVQNVESANNNYK